jgi:hypothetical protein
MRCPYCISEIDDLAIACPHCARDLYLFKPLLEKINQLEKAIAEQAKAVAAGAETRIAALEAEVAALKQATASAVPVQLTVESGEVEGSRPDYALALLKTLLPAFALLVAAHGVLLFVFDVKPLILRVTTLLIPMPFGFLLASHFAGRFWKSAGAGFVVALAAVWAMLAVTATIDKVPVLPQDARDLRETAEYVLGIGLAFAAGVMVGEFLPAFKEKGSPPHRVMLLVARAVTPDEDGKLGIEKAGKKIDKLMKVAAPAATAAASLYAGIKSFLGDLG